MLRPRRPDRCRHLTGRRLRCRRSTVGERPPPRRRPAEPRTATASGVGPPGPSATPPARAVRVSPAPPAPACCAAGRGSRSRRGCHVEYGRPPPAGSRGARDRQRASPFRPRPCRCRYRRHYRHGHWLDRRGSSQRDGVEPSPRRDARCRCGSRARLAPLGDGRNRDSGSRPQPPSVLSAHSWSNSPSCGPRLRLRCGSDGLSSSAAPLRSSAAVRGRTRPSVRRPWQHCAGASRRTSSCSVPSSSSTAIHSRPATEAGLGWLVLSSSPSRARPGGQSPGHVTRSPARPARRR